MFELFVAEELAGGTLVKLLGRYSPPPETFYLYYANRAQMPGKLRAFVDFLQASSRGAFAPTAPPS